jgi:hypothetical protein
MDTLRKRLVELREAENPIAHIHPRSVEWWRVVEASGALQARLHELEDQAMRGLAAELEGVTREGFARLAAGVRVVGLRMVVQLAWWQLFPNSSMLNPSAFRSNLKQDLQAVLTLLSLGQIRAHIAARFPLSEVATAMELAESRTVYGKVVLLP